MSGLPWYPRYTGDYARKTKHLSLLEHGAYTILLDYYYATGEALPSKASSNASSNAELMPDHGRLYRICGAITKIEQDAVDYIIGMFFKLDDEGNYINKKAEEVIEQQTEKHNKRVEAGRKGGSKAKSNANSNASSKAKAKPKQPEPEPEPDKPPNPLKGGTGVFMIQDSLIAKGIEDARRNAPNWDMEGLYGVYNAGVNEGKRPPPKRPNEAFPAWCLSYTKGKPPQ